MLLQLPSSYQQTNPYENAFFPYSYGVYSIIRHWVESKPAYGQRIASQAYDPFRKDWNSPRFTEYYDLAFVTFNLSTFLLDAQLVNLSDLPDDQLLLLIKKYFLTPDQLTVVIRYFNSGRPDLPTDNLIWRDPQDIPSLQNRNIVPELFLEPNKYPKAIPLAQPEIKRRKNRRKSKSPELTPEQQAIYDSLLKKM